MTDGFPRPRIVVSQCLGFAAVRYNGAIIRDDFIQLLAQHVDVVEVCPEVGIGLGVPRDPIRLQQNGEELALVQMATARDLTNEMHAYAVDLIESLEDIDAFILKSRSPSCGVRDVSVFAGETDTIKTTAAGMFAQHVLTDFAGVPITDEMQLKNRSTRYDFLTSVFTLARFRAATLTGNIADLIAFHTQCKYLLMSLDPGTATEMGRIIAAGTSYTTKRDAYERALRMVLAREHDRGRWANAMLHVLGYFPDRGADRKNILAQIEQYRTTGDDTARDFVTNGLRTMAMTRDQPYIKAQFLFSPFPLELA